MLISPEITLFNKYRKPRQYLTGLDIALSYAIYAIIRQILTRFSSLWTPFIKQYYEMKSKHRDAILLFRIGDYLLLKMR